MGGINQSPSFVNQGYKPVSVFEKDGQYYKRELRSPSQKGQVSPRPGQFGGSPTPGGPLNKGAVSPMSFQPINFGGAGSPRVPSSSRYSKPSLYTPRRSRASKVPSYDPNNPQEDAIKDPKLREAASDLNEQAPPGERLAFINPAEEKLLKAVGGSGMTAAGGIPSYKKGDVEAPPPRDYYKETADTLAAQVQLAPELYAKEAIYRPQYANLERGIMLEQLGLDPSLSLLEAMEEIGLAQNEQKAIATEGEIGMLSDYGQEFVEAMRAADPLAEELRQGVMQTAMDDLSSEGGLTEEEMRLVDQRILEGAADRGMSEQKSTLMDQIRGQLDADRAVKQTRLQNASAAYGMGAVDPLLALTGRSAMAPSMNQQGFGGAAFSLDSSPALFNPESAYAGALNTQNYQAEMDARTASAANSAGIMSGLMGMGGDILGGMATGGTGFFKPKGK
jgi:hypothetical protein